MGRSANPIVDWIFDATPLKVVSIDKVYRLCGLGEGEVRVVESHSEKF